MNALLRAALIGLLAPFSLGFGIAHSQTVSQPPCLQATGNGKCVSPEQIRSLYGVTGLLNRGITGKGRTIAIIDSYGDPTIRSDLHTFDKAFGFSDPQLTVAAPLGSSAPTTADGKLWYLETALDVEWAHVIAPGAKILLLTSPVNETEGTIGMPQFLKLLRYARSHGADVVSQSWAVTEQTLMTKKGRSVVSQFHNFYNAASKAGISFTGGAGDSGTMGLDMSLTNSYPTRQGQFPASDPHVLAVGGTTISAGTDGSLSEVAWTLGGTGLSKFFAEPSYQKVLPAGVQKLLAGRRGYPDVAYDAAPESGVPIVVNGQWLRSGGTSSGTPQWAGILALADQSAGKRLGDVHTSLYAIAGSSRYHKDFHDITSGIIKDPPEVTAAPFHAAAGWDLATGLGTPNAVQLVPDLVKRAG
jgi:subtilase family serine protease